MSRHLDTTSARPAQLGVPGAPRGELASHQGGPRHTEAAERAARGAAQGLGERRGAPGLTDPPQGDVWGKGPGLAGEAERGEGFVDSPRQIAHRAGSRGPAGPDDARSRSRREGPEALDLGFERGRADARPSKRAGDSPDTILGDRAEELHREMKVARR